ncbi:flavin monoamine oxidase family protein [Vibrio sp. WXL210]|uniref:flavin monoamine oxidase family protein n=1 Tax=Vibrio sp. WXL210 TaxID=3450709 RepID=UPI003EC74B27
MNSNNQFSRRDFIHKIALLGGTGAAFAALGAFNIRHASASDAPPILKGGDNGKTVLVLGAGIAGLTAAYELKNKGYNVKVLEARDFAGGRCQTARKGTVIEELGGHRQVCDFESGQYLNLGPMRIPSHHKSTLYYTKKFNVPLETYINYNENSWVYFENGQGELSGSRVRMREVLADMRGYTGELMAKAVNSDSLDLPLSTEDRHLFLEYLISEGQLDKQDLSYKGYSGRGYHTDPAALLNSGEYSKPHKLDSLLHSNLWKVSKSVSSYSQPKTVFQPIGGMDKIAQAFEENTKELITYNAEITKLRQSNGKVNVDYKNTKTGSVVNLEADYCVCTIPLSVLKQIDTDFSAEFKQAIQAVAYTPTCKLGIQTSRRFWEEDDEIYGGHCLNNIGSPRIGGITYPSHDMFGQKGVLLSAYNYNGDAAQFSAMSPEKRFAHAVKEGTKIHGKAYEQHAEKAASISWHLTKYNLGGWASWSSEGREKYYPTLCEPEGNVFLAGEHMSYLTGWMAGAIESAWEQIEKIDQINQAAA